MKMIDYYKINVLKTTKRLIVFVYMINLLTLHSEI
jgi:hypothetical protein